MYIHILHLCSHQKSGNKSIKLPAMSSNSGLLWNAIPLSCYQNQNFIQVSNHLYIWYLSWSKSSLILASDNFILFASACGFGSRNYPWSQQEASEKSCLDDKKWFVLKEGSLLFVARTTAITLWLWEELSYMLRGWKRHERLWVFDDITELLSG